MLETRKQIQSREVRMTWTLIGISFCYLIFVGPIYMCTMFTIQDWPNLICFSLYWFQYTTNFVIYAGRSEQYRRAYTQYIKTTLPWLWDFTDSDRKHLRHPRTCYQNIFLGGRKRRYSS